MKPTMSEAESKPVRPGKQRRKAELRAGYLALFEKSGMRAVDFCREHGLGTQTFYNWRQQARRDVGTPVRARPAFAQVTVAASAGVAAGTVRLQLPGGLAFEVPAGTDPIWLAQVLREVGALG
jgi:transposase-like protein